MSEKGMCRVCLNDDFEKVLCKGLSLFDKCNDCVISEQINALTNIDIKEGDGLPDRICPTCILDLENAYMFKQKCENTNKILLSAINNDPTEEADLPIKEESINDEEDFDYVEENITLACSLAAGSDVLPDVEAPIKPSKAIDLKLECNDCGGFFKSKCKLRVHWKKVHMTETLKCSNCLRKFKTFAAMKSHKKKNLKSCTMAAKIRIEGEGRSRVFHCKECNYKAGRVANVIAHSVIHSGERPFQCDICSKSFRHHTTLLYHKEFVHKLFGFEGTCHYCGKHIQGRIKLCKHIRRHMRNNRFPCDICNSVLKSKENLLNHMNKHSGIKSYICEVCSSPFYTYSGLYNHKKLVHFKSKWNTCEECDFKSVHYGRMASHKRKHSASNVACNVCGTFLDNEQQLVLHKKRHTDRHHQCPHCDKSYYARKGLCTHIRKVHTQFVKKVNGTASKVLNKSVNSSIKTKN